MLISINTTNFVNPQHILFCDITQVENGYMIIFVMNTINSIKKFSIPWYKRIFDKHTYKENVQNDHVLLFSKTFSSYNEASYFI